MLVDGIYICHTNNNWKFIKVLNSKLLVIKIDVKDYPRQGRKVLKYYNALLE